MTPGDHTGDDHTVDKDTVDERDPGESAGARSTESDLESDLRADSETDAGEPEPEWVRRRRLDAVFGDGAHGQALGDRWYRDQVPPHHG